MTDPDLLAALTAERYNGGGWRPTHEPEPACDDELTTARRRRLLAEEYDRVHAAEREAR
jgi:hypothetical protein